MKNEFSKALKKLIRFSSVNSLRLSKSWTPSKAIVWCKRMLKNWKNLVVVRITQRGSSGPIVNHTITNCQLVVPELCTKCVQPFSDIGG